MPTAQIEAVVMADGLRLNGYRFDGKLPVERYLAGLSSVAPVACWTAGSSIAS